MENFITTSAYLQVEDTEEPTIKFIYFSVSDIDYYIPSDIPLQ